MSICLKLYDDCLLNGTITYFEAYMFATTPKHIGGHTSFDERLIIVDGDRSNHIIPMVELEERKKALTLFNKLAKEQIPSMPKPTGLSCCMIDLVDENNEYEEKELNSCYKELEDLFLQWSAENNRVGVMVQHFYQGDRYPHVHILYQRGRGKHNEFQNFLCERLG